jgi:hypothetical protein
MYGVLKYIKHNQREQEEMNGNKITLNIHKNETTRQNLIQPTISLEIPVPSQGRFGFHSFAVVD